MLGGLRPSFALSIAGATSAATVSLPGGDIPWRISIGEGSALAAAVD